MVSVWFGFGFGFGFGFELGLFYLFSHIRKFTDSRCNEVLQ